MKKIIFILLGIIALTSCNPSQRAYNELESFTIYLEESNSTFSEEDWNNAIYQYNAVVTNVNAQFYNDEELVEIGKLKGRCVAILTKHSITNTGKELKNILLEAEGFVQSIVDEFSKELSTSYQ